MPVVSIEGPAGISRAAKQKMMKKIHAAVGEAFEAEETLIFIREYGRENVAFNGESNAAGPESSTPARAAS